MSRTSGGQTQNLQENIRRLALFVGAVALPHVDAGVDDHHVLLTLLVQTVDKATRGVVRSLMNAAQEAAPLNQRHWIVDGVKGEVLLVVLARGVRGSERPIRDPPCGRCQTKWCPGEFAPRNNLRPPGSADRFTGLQSAPHLLQPLHVRVAVFALVPAEGPVGRQVGTADRHLPPGRERAARIKRLRTWYWLTTSLGCGPLKTKSCRVLSAATEALRCARTTSMTPPIARKVALPGFRITSSPARPRARCQARRPVEGTNRSSCAGTLRALLLCPVAGSGEAQGRRDASRLTRGEVSR
jgi:hypothetical protein